MKKVKKSESVKISFCGLKTKLEFLIKPKIFKNKSDRSKKIKLGNKKWKEFKKLEPRWLPWKIEIEDVLAELLLFEKSILFGAKIAELFRLRVVVSPNSISVIEPVCRDIFWGIMLGGSNLEYIEISKCCEKFKIQEGRDNKKEHIQWEPHKKLIRSDQEIPICLE